MDIFSYSLLVFIQKSPEQLQQIDELGSYLNNESVEQARCIDLDRNSIEDSFIRTFDFLAQTLHENAFRQYDPEKGRYSGPMLVSLFEVVAVVLGYHLLNGGGLPDTQAYSEKHQEL